MTNPFEFTPAQNMFHGLRGGRDERGPQAKHAAKVDLTCGGRRLHRRGWLDPFIHRPVSRALH